MEHLAQYRHISSMLMPEHQTYSDWWSEDYQWSDSKERYVYGREITNVTEAMLREQRVFLFDDED